MQGKCHVAIGVASLALFCVEYPLGFEFAGTTVLPEVGMLTAAIGSYLPDIDMPRTHMGMKHSHLSKFIQKHGGHRGPTHSICLPSIFTALGVLVALTLPKYADSLVKTVPLLSNAVEALSMFLMSLIFGMVFGYAMHLFADAFNGKGIALFWPITSKKFHIPFMDIPSEGPGQWIFAIILILIEACFVLRLNPITLIASML